MSGNFTQRGLPACADKYSRARHALIAGADMVVELPTVFATASAENFAYGAVEIVKKINANCVVFGSECGDIDVLRACLDKLDNADTQTLIKKEMSKGVSYPKALALATEMDVLNKPNNVLAIEYLRAMRNSRCNAVAFTLKREDNYNGTAPTEYASSAMLRRNSELRSKYTFDYVIQDIDETIADKYRQAVPLFLSVATKEQLCQTEGVSEGLENRIFNSDKTKDYEELMEQIKTKRYTRLKLQRIVLNYILGIDKETVIRFKNANFATPLLAAKKSAAHLIAHINNGIDEVTQRADRLYYALAGKIPDSAFRLSED